MVSKKDKNQREEVSTYGHIKDDKGNTYFKKERKIFSGEKKSGILNLWPEPDAVIEEFWVKRANGKLETTDPFEVEGADPTIFLTKKYKLIKKDALWYNRHNNTDRSIPYAWVFFISLFMAFFGICFEIIDYLAKN